MGDEEQGLEGPFTGGPMDADDPGTEVAANQAGDTVDDPTPSGADLTALQERAVRAEQERERTQRLLEQTLQTRAPVPAAPAAPPAPEPLPDPVADAAGFQAAIDRRFLTQSQAHQREVQQLRQENQELSATQGANELFNDFVSTRPGLRDKRALVDSAAREAGVSLNDPKGVIFERTENQLRAWGVSMGEKQALPGKPKKRDDAAAAAVGGASNAAGGKKKKSGEDDEVVGFVDALEDRRAELGLS